MQSPQLPLEIICGILELTVSDLRIFRAAELRLVNRLFDREILRACAKTNAIDTEGHPNKPRPAGLLARYALQRPYPEDSPVDASFMTVMNYVVDELVRHEDDGDERAEHLQFEYMKKLLSWVDRYDDIHMRLKDPTPINLSASRDRNRHHVLLAAIYLGVDDRFLAVPEYQKLNMSKVKSQIFGTPLLAAIDGRHYDRIREFSAYYRAHDLQRGWYNIPYKKRPFKFKSYLHPVVDQGDTEMVRLLLQLKHGFNTYKIRDAFDLAMSRKESDIACLLLDHLKPDTFSRQQLTLYLGAACKDGMLETVDRLVSLGANVNCERRVLRGIRPAVLAAWAGHKEILQYLIDHGLDIHDADFAFFAMRGAAWGGHADIAELLLDAGVQLDPSTWLKALEAAYCVPEAGEMFQLLVDRGLLPHIEDTEPDDVRDQLRIGMIKATGTGNIGAIKALIQLGVPLNDTSFYFEYKEHPPPVVIAVAFRQKHLVPLLIELGATPMAPEESVWADQLHYPRPYIYGDDKPRKCKRLGLHPVVILLCGE